MTGNIEIEAVRFIQRADSLYRALVAGARRDHRRGRIARAVRGVQNAARLACFAHTGRFADGRLENLLLEIGRHRVPAGRITPRPSDGPMSVLHVATRLLATGGHTRLLLNWIRQDPDRLHSLVVLDQPEADVPPEVRDTVIAAGGTVTVLPRPAADAVGAAIALRARAELTADIVMLHAHQFDAIPILAFATEGGPPVALVNHSDHTFWLGTSVADVVVPFRPFGERLGGRRSARRQLLVPLPLQLRHSTVTREEARRCLGLGPDDVALLTIGARYKYEPTVTHDFFARAAAVLEADYRAQLFVVGMTDAELPASAAPLRSSARAHFLGVVPEPALYQAASDLYLEGFPLGSQTALLESVAMGAAPVLMHDPSAQLDMSEEEAFRGRVPLPARGTGEYEARLLTLIRNESMRERLAAATRDATISSHTGQRWLARADALYEMMLDTAHRPAPIPESESEFTSTDLARAAWDSHLFARGPLAVLAARETLRVAELLRCIAESVLVGDTHLSIAHLHAWAAAVKRHVLGAPIE